MATLQITRKLALGAASLGLMLVPTAALARGSQASSVPKAPTRVTVRVEGLTRTLLGSTAVTVPTSGWITKGGAKPGDCRAASAAGALDRATHHHWYGTWNSSFGDYEITWILGEGHPFTSKNYWSIWLNGRFAPSGVCGMSLHRGDQLLFAAVPDTFNGYPLYLRAPHQARVGGTITATAGYFGKSGFTPAGGVHVTAPGLNAITDRHGQVHIRITHTGTLVLHSHGTGYIRAAVVRVRELP